MKLLIPLLVFGTFVLLDQTLAENDNNNRNDNKETATHTVVDARNHFKVCGHD